MSVKVGKLFRDNRFVNLDSEAKLLYIYLVTHPDINVVGVLSPDLEVVKIQNRIGDLKFKHYCLELVNKKYIYIKKYEDVVYFIIPDHFNTIPKSQASIMKINKTLAGYPKGLKLFLKSLGITSDSKLKVFKKPTPEEVNKFCLKQGYVVNAKEFINFYEEMAFKYGKDYWVDSNGKQVLDWRGKLRKVWFKDTNKIRVFSDAPEGYDKFYIEKDGRLIFPDGWKDGKPFSKTFLDDVELKKQFNNK